MSIAFPTIDVGDPLYHDGLTVFPLFAEPNHGVEYDLSDEAIHRGTVTVEEISEAGSVPDLAVENKGNLRVLFLEGEELVGAKQNRVLNTSVLIAAHTNSKIPVSCVEAGRWGYKSRQFDSGGTHSPSALRRVIKASVSKSIRASRGYCSDQSEVWREVARQQTALGASSGTTAMSDTFAAHQKRLDDFQERLPYVEGAIGAAVAVDGRVVAVDLFDKASTCKRVWNRLLSGAILDALEVQGDKKQADRTGVDRALKDFGDMPWESAESVGEGEEFRAESPTGDHASALVLEGTLVHGSVLCEI